MPSWSERRKFRRYPMQLPLLHAPIAPPAPSAGVGWTRDVSEGGACVETGERLPPGLPLRLRLLTDRGTIEAEAQVAWSGEPRGPEGGILHGLAFTQVTPDQHEALRHLLLTRAMVRPAGVRLPVQVSVTCQPRGEAGPPLQAWTSNISRGGLLLRLPQVLPPGTALEITLYTLTGLVRVEGTVAWVAPPEARTPEAPIRHGFEFTALEWSTAHSLARFLAEAT